MENMNNFFSLTGIFFRLIIMQHSLMIKQVLKYIKILKLLFSNLKLNNRCHELFILVLIFRLHIHLDSSFSQNKYIYYCKIIIYSSYKMHYHLHNQFYALDYEMIILYEQLTYTIIQEILVYSESTQINSHQLHVKTEVFRNTLNSKHETHFTAFLGSYPFLCRFSYGMV